MKKSKISVFVCNEKGNFRKINEVKDISSSEAFVFAKSWVGQETQFGVLIWPTVNPLPEVIQARLIPDSAVTEGGKING
jgi:hypothetical protein